MKLRKGTRSVFDGVAYRGAIGPFQLEISRRKLRPREEASPLGFSGRLIIASSEFPKRGWRSPTGTLASVRAWATKQWMRWWMNQTAGMHPGAKGLLDACWGGKDDLAPSALADWLEENDPARLALLARQGRDARVVWPHGWETMADRARKEGEKR